MGSVQQLRVSVTRNGPVPPNTVTRATCAAAP
jgi:hypothetical protein